MRESRTFFKKRGGGFPWKKFFQGGGEVVQVLFIYKFIFIHVSFNFQEGFYFYRSAPLYRLTQSPVWRQEASSVLLPVIPSHYDANHWSVKGQRSLKGYTCCAVNSIICNFVFKMCAFKNPLSYKEK